MRYDRDNLLRNLVIVSVGWAILFFFGLLIFHLGLSVSVHRIALFCAISCIMQLCITPWLIISSRRTNGNPSTKTRQTALALAIWITSNLFVVLVFVQYGRAANWTATLWFDGLISTILALRSSLSAHLEWQGRHNAQLQRANNRP
jgi:hypothetical protein